MAVAFDAVGPAGGAGKASTSSKTITWTHTSVGTSGLAGIVAVAQDASSATNAAYTCSVTWGGVAMTSLGRVASQNTPQYGYIQLFGLISPPTGTQTITVTCSGTAPHLIGSSLSFTGAASFGTAATASGGSDTASVTVTGTGASNMLVGAFCAGQPFGATPAPGDTTTTPPTAPLVKRALDSVDTANGAGNFALGTAPGAAVAEALAWPLTDNAWGAVGVEVVAAAPTNPPLSTLASDFTTMPAFFSTNFGNPGPTAVDGQLSVPCTYGYAGGKTDPAYSFTDDTIFWQMAQVSGTTGSLQTSGKIEVDGTNSIEMLMDGGDFHGRVTRASTTYDTELAGGVYDPVAHAWWQVREAGGIVYWDTSPDGITWTNQGSAAHQLDLTTVDLALQAGHWNVADPDGVNALFDNLNTVPVAPITPWHAVLDGTYTTNVQAGFEDDNWNRDDGSGGYGTLPWPITLVTAPGGRPGQAVPYVMPAGYKRHESVAAAPYFEDGDFAYFGDAFYLDAGFPIDGYGGGYQVITQLRQADDTGSPGMALEVSGGVLKVTGGYGVTGANPADEYAYSVTLLDGIATQTWYAVVWSLNFSSTPGGSVLNVWVDGTQVLTDYTIPSPTVQDTADGQGTYWKSGLYRDPAGAPAATIYHAGTAFGATYADADPYLAPTTTTYQGSGTAVSGTVAQLGAPTATTHAVASAVSGTVAGGAVVRSVPIPTGPAIPADALQQRTLDEIHGFEDWLAANHADGYVGELATPAKYAQWGDPAQQDQWNALIGTYLSELDRFGMHGSVWAAGRNWGSGYPLGLQVGANPGDPLSIRNDTVPTVCDHPSRGGYWHGVNLSGWEQGVSVTGGGTVRSSAGYVHNDADFAFLAADGVNYVRLPMAWERVQTAVSTALDTTALATLDGMLTAAHNHGISVGLDLHNYARYTDADGTVRVLGDTLTQDHLSDFWTRLVAWLAADPVRDATVVLLGLMNEPHDVTGGLATWQTVSQAVLTAIRDAGDTRLISVAGYAWSHVETWADNHPGGGWITDPGQSFCYEGHHYWDTQTDPSVGGPRSGQYQQSNGAGGVETETYATELAAAVTQVGLTASAVSGTVTALGGTRTTTPTAGAVSGSTAALGGTRATTLTGTAATSGTVAELGGTRTTVMPATRSVSGTVAALAPSVMTAATVVSGTVALGDGWKSTGGIPLPIVSGTRATLLAPGTVPPEAGQAISGSVATVAELRLTTVTAAAVSGSRAVGDGTRETFQVGVVAVSGSVATAPVVLAQAIAAAAVSGTVALTAEYQTQRSAAIVVSGTVVGLLPAGLNQSISGSRATAATVELAHVTAWVVSGTVVAAPALSAERQVGGKAISGTVVAAVATTVVRVAPSSAVSGSRAQALAVTVKIGAAVVVSGSRVTAWAAVAVTITSRVVSGTLAQLTSATQYHPAFVRPAGTPDRRTPAPRTTLLVVDTVTGKRVAALPYTSLSWNSPLNDVGKYSATVPLEAGMDALSDQRVRDPRAALRAILSGPYRFSLVPCYGNTALMGGPLLPSTDIAGDRVTVGGSGMELMLDKRVLNRPTGTGLLADASRDVSVSATNVNYAVYAAVAEAITTYGGMYPARSLPLTCSNPPPQLGTEGFVWNSYDLVSAWKAITDLIARTDGPDVRLDPYLYEWDDGFYVYWELEIGDPYLPVSGNTSPQGPTPWSFGAANTQLAYAIDPSGMASSYFASGDGQDRTKDIARADDDTLTSLGFPALEQVDSTAASTTSTSGVNDTADRAQSLIAAHATPTNTWKLTIPVDGSPDIGMVRRGDLARIEVRDLLYLENGYHYRRITNVAGSDARTAVLDCDDDGGVPDPLLGVL